MFMDNPNCDGNGPHSLWHEIRVLPTGGASNLNLCRLCHSREILWRAERNCELSADNTFDLPEWDSLQIYEPQS